jgi:hypothetical protein
MIKPPREAPPEERLCDRCDLRFPYRPHHQQGRFCPSCLLLVVNEWQADQATEIARFRCVVAGCARRVTA